MASVTTATSAPYRRQVSSSLATYSAFPSPPSSLSRPASVSSRPRRHTHSASDASNITAGLRKSSNNLLAKYSIGLEDTFLGEVDDKPRQSSITALSDFLKNQQPPPSNYMSTPEVFEDDKERGRWAKWKSLGRRSSSAPRYPQRILLPDSAVSGMTIGGFRHIAISIPLEASPFGHSTASQYPVYSKTDATTNGGKHPSVRTYMNEKGVVTVLRTVREDREASSARPRFVDRNSEMPEVPKRKSKSRLSAESPVSKRDSSGSRRATYNKPSSTVTSDGSIYPARGSSITRNAQYRPEVSIDGLIARVEPHDQPPTKIITLGDEDIVMAEAQLDVMPEDSPARSKSKPLKPAPSRLSDLHITAETDNDLPKTRESTKSHKGFVRDRKRRDVESTHANQAEPQDAEFEPLDMTIAPIRIVVDVEPTEEIFVTPDQTPNSMRPVSSPVPPLDIGESLTSSHLEVEDSSAGRPFTPTSPRYDDRTSISRRREWNTTREARRQSDEAKQAKEAVRLRAKRLLAAALSPSEDEKPTLQADQEILRLYESYRDHRLREMDRRVRRLERNGDVWLRALVPVLNNLNRSLNVQQYQQRGATVSDGGYALEEESRKREIGAEIPYKGSAAEQRFYERLSKADEENIPTGLISGSEGDSGSSIVEPLIRELAGEAKRRQRRALAKRVGGEDDYDR